MKTLSIQRSAPQRRAFVTSLALGLLFIACESTDGFAAAPAGPASRASARTTEAASPAKTAASKAAMVTTSMAFPTGDPRTSALLVDKLVPGQVIAGELFEMALRVTNLTEQPLENVVITESLGENLELEESSVKPESTGGNRIWKLGNLGPNQCKVVNLTATAKKPERVETCLSVAYDTTLCTTIPVVQPALELVASGTPSALACDEIVYRYVVSNTGTGTAENVNVRIELPEGLADEHGRRSITRSVGALSAGKAVELTLSAKASKTGIFEHSASAMGSPHLTAKSDVVATTVTRPVLAITASGTEKAFGGRSLSYDITVKNTGDGMARDALLEDEIPAGLGFLSATPGGRLFGGKVQWSLGDLAPGGTATVNLKLKADNLGTFVNRASARSQCAEVASATATSNVTGIPAILLEVVDVADPIEVGQVETYVITVTNQGSAQDTNIKVTVTMPGTKFVSAEGSTQAMAGAGASGTITLAPVGVLAPKAKATWQIRLRGREAADARFTVSMISDQLSSPVTENEATNYYE
jgi:uncharacterized repeat protein (TIGR01451 family)